MAIFANQTLQNLRFISYICRNFAEQVANLLIYNT